MIRLPSRLSLVFSSIGHGYMHLFAVYLYLVVLPLEREWGLPYPELIGLWTVGSLLIGAVALPVGWIADRWSATGMMVVFFVGLGTASIACGLATGPRTLWAGLCLLGHVRVHLSSRRAALAGPDCRDPRQGAGR